MALINPTEADLTRDKKVNWRKLTSANNPPVFASRYYRRHFIHTAIGYFLDICWGKYSSHLREFEQALPETW